MRKGDVRWLAAVSLGLGSVQLAYSSYSTALPLVQLEWGLSNAAAGLIQAAFYAGYLLAVVVLLPLTDRQLPTKYVWAGSVLLTSVANVLFPLLASGPASAMVWRGLAGFGTVGVYMPGVRLVSERFPATQRGALVGIYLSAFGLASALSFALTGALIPWLGWRGAYLSAGGIGFLGLIPAWYVLGRVRSVPVEERRASPAPLGAALTHRPLLLAVLSYAVHNWELIGMKAWMVPFLAAALTRQGRELVQATAQGAILTAALSILGAAAMGFAGRVSDRYGRTYTSSAIMMVGAACSFGIGWLIGAPFWLLAAVSMVYGIAAVAESPVITTTVTELAPPGRLGAAQASQSFLGNATSLLAPVAFGAILDTGVWGGWGLAFSSLGLGSLVGVGLMLGLRYRSESLALAGGRR